MSYEHLYDICPADEGNGMVDSIELRAVSVLAKFADGKISCDDFGDEMMRIGEELNKQMEDGDGNIVIDASVPQWLIMFMGNKFSKWNMMRMQINAARQNPKITSDPRWSEVEKMVKQENDVLMHAVRHSLTLWHIVKADCRYPRRFMQMCLVRDIMPTIDKNPYIY